MTTDVSKAIQHLMGVDNGETLQVWVISSLLQNDSRPYTPQAQHNLEMDALSLAWGMWHCWAQALSIYDRVTVTWTEEGEVTFTAEKTPGPLVLITNLDYDALWLIPPADTLPVKQRINRGILMNTLLRGKSYVVDSDAQFKLGHYLGKYPTQEKHDVYCQHRGMFFIVHTTPAPNPLVFFVYDHPNGQHFVTNESIVESVVEERMVTATSPEPVTLEATTERAVERGIATQDSDPWTNTGLNEGHCTSWMGFDYGVAAGIKALFEQLSAEGYRILDPAGNDVTPKQGD